MSGWPNTGSREGRVNERIHRGTAGGSASGSPPRLEPDGDLHDDLNEDTSRPASAIAALGERGLLTPEDMERIARRGCNSRPALRAQQLPDHVTEGEITAAILGGDLDAFHRRRVEEED